MKLYSTITVISALVLVLYDVPRVMDVLVWHRGAAGRPVALPFHSHRLNRARWVVKVLLVGSVLWSCVSALGAFARDYEQRERAPLWGMWDVTSFVVDGRELAQSAEPARWRRVTTSLYAISIRFEDDRKVSCEQKLDETARTLTLTCAKTHQDGELHWTREGGVLRLDGMFDRHRVSASLTLHDPEELPLKRAEFRWIVDGGSTADRRRINGQSTAEARSSDTL